MRDDVASLVHSSYGRRIANIPLSTLLCKLRVGHGFCRRRRFYKLLLLIQIALVVYALNKFFGTQLEDGCDIPQLNPWNETILEYAWYHQQEIKCERKQPELTVLHRETQRIWFNANELAAAGLTMRKLRCMYRCFDVSDVDKEALRFDDWAKLTNGTFIGKEMVEIRCWRSGNETAVIYENAHSQIIPIDEDERISESKGETPNKVDKEENAKNEGDEFLNRPNVILFVVDSMSHSSWIRELPQTLSVLNQTYGSFIFKGMMKVDDNSYPNTLAFLTGHRNKELWMKYGRKYYDNWPFVFFEYRKHGYATYMAEDMHKHPIFNYDPEMYFFKKPFDHSYRPYGIQLRKYSQLAKNSTWYCYGNNPLNKDQLGYLQDFVRKYSNNNMDTTQDDKRRRPIFAINWSAELSHGTLNLVSTADKDYARFFTESAPLIADNTFVFAFGDHGARYHAIRETYVGRIEEQMPFFSMHVPQPLLDRYPQLVDTLNTNVKRVSTWWDFHVTLREILDLSLRNGWHELAGHTKQHEKRYRDEYGAKLGLSLLRPLPLKRGCKGAHIPVEYCVCEPEIVVDAQSKEVNAAAVELVRHVNQLLAEGEYGEGVMCSELTLYNVTRALSFKVRTKPEINYRVVVRVTPSDALLEGTLRHDDYNYERFQVVGQVSRLNSYAGQSDCTNSKILGLYCYCIEAPL